MYDGIPPPPRIKCGRRPLVPTCSSAAQVCADPALKSPKPSPPGCPGSCFMVSYPQQRRGGEETLQSLGKSVGHIPQIPSLIQILIRLDPCPRVCTPPAPPGPLHSHSSSCGAQETVLIADPGVVCHGIFFGFQTPVSWTKSPFCPPRARLPHPQLRGSDDATGGSSRTKTWPAMCRASAPLLAALLQCCTDLRPL